MNFIALGFFIMTLGIVGMWFPGILKKVTDIKSLIFTAWVFFGLLLCSIGEIINILKGKK